MLITLSEVTRPRNECKSAPKYDPLECQMDQRVIVPIGVGTPRRLTAYRAKYPGNGYLEPITSARARSATLRIMPRSATVRPSDAGEARRQTSQERQ